MVQTQLQTNSSMVITGFQMSIIQNVQQLRVYQQYVCLEQWSNMYV